MAESLTSPELAETFRERDERFRADLRADIDAGIAAGDIRPDVDARAAAVAILGQLRGIALQRLLDPTAVDTDRLRHTVREQWRRTLT